MPLRPGIDAHEVRLEDFEDTLDAKMATARQHGNHLWAAVVTFSVADEALETMKGDSPTPLQMSHENLLTYPVVGCLACEQPYTPWLARRRCAGDPSRVPR